MNGLLTSEFLAPTVLLLAALAHRAYVRRCDAVIESFERWLAELPEIDGSK